MNDMIENFPDKVICLLFSFFDKLKMATQCSDFLDGTSKGQVSRFRRFLQESICSWIRVVNDVADGIIYWNESKLALLCGNIRRYPHILDVQANSWLLMELIGALHLLSMDEASKTSSPITTKFLSVSDWRLDSLDVILLLVWAIVLLLPIFYWLFYSVFLFFWPHFQSIHNRSNRLIPLYFTAVSEACREYSEKSLGAFFLMKPTRLFMSHRPNIYFS